VCLRHGCSASLAYGLGLGPLYYLLATIFSALTPLFDIAVGALLAMSKQTKNRRFRPEGK
jgi:hypothetical protein